MKKFFILFIFTSLLVGSYAWAQNFGNSALDSAVVGTGLSGNLEGKIGSIIASILGLLGTIFLVLTIYAGILWMTASGEEAKIDKAKQIITAAVIGLAIVMSAYTITYFVSANLGASSQPTDPKAMVDCVINGETFKVTTAECNNLKLEIEE